MRVPDKNVFEAIVDGRTHVALECLLLICARLVELLQVNVVSSVRLMSQRVHVRERVCILDWSVNSQRAARRCKMEDAFGRRVASAEQWYVLASASIKVFFVDLDLDHSRSADVNCPSC